MSTYIEFYPGFGARLQELRERYKLNMREFAKLIGTSPSTYFRYEHEQTKRMPQEVFDKIVELDMSTTDKELLYSLTREKDDSIDETVAYMQNIIDSLREENDCLRRLLTGKWIKEWEAQNNLFEITMKHNLCTDQFFFK